MSAVMHQPRIAWDAALLLIRAAQAETIAYTWCRDHIGAVLGSAYQQRLDETREQVGGPLDASATKDVQAAIWRVRLEDELRGEPRLAAELAQFTTELRTRLAA